MQIVKNEGWRAFFKGLTPACIHIAPMSGLVFGLNHIFTTFVRKINGNIISFYLNFLTNGFQVNNRNYLLEKILPAVVLLDSALKWLCIPLTW